MPITKQDLTRLVGVQEQDKLLDSIEAAIRLIPEDIAALRSEIEAEKTKFNAWKEKTIAVQLRKKEKELELSKQEELVRKHTQDLNQVKTNAAFKALQSEIDRAKAQGGDIETEILMIMEEADAFSLEEKTLKTEVARVEADLQKQIGVLESRKSEQEARLAEEKGKRAALAVAVPPDLLDLYDQTRKRRRGIGISRVRGNLCEVCHMTLPPQDVLNTIKGTTIVHCDSCQRILYNSESAATAKPAA